MIFPFSPFSILEGWTRCSNNEVYPPHARTLKHFSEIHLAFLPVEYKQLTQCPTSGSLLPSVNQNDPAMKNDQNTQVGERDR